MPPIIRQYVAVGAGFYTQWSFVVGAPLHWLAVINEGPSVTYIASATNGQRDSFLFGGPVLKPDETLMEIRISAWLQWGGSPLGANARVVPFYRLGTVDVDIDPLGWIITPESVDDPTFPGPMFQGPDFIVPPGLGVNQLIPSTGPLNRLAVQFGVRNVTPRRAHVHALKIQTTTRPYSDRATMAGHRGWTRRRSA